MGKQRRVYILKECSDVDLDFLGLDRFTEANRYKDQAEEDAHCANVRNLGAVLWEIDLDHCTGKTFPELPRLSRNARWVTFGRPVDGGVWSFFTNNSDSGNRRLVSVKNVCDMAHQCQLIKGLGGTFYPEPKDCPHLDLEGSMPPKRVVLFLYR